MKKITTKEPFITDSFLLKSKEAKVLYHDYAKNMPIIDYHNHLSARKIAENKTVKNITDVWLSGDHYKWRAMRANGIDEEFITGATSLEDRFMKWAETAPMTLRNPLFHWNQLELKRYFDIDEVLQKSNAIKIYEKANSVLAKKTPADLLKDMNVEVVCTTDDPTDDLRYHKSIAKQDFFTKVYPTFRPDEIFLIEKNQFKKYVKKLEKVVEFSIKSLKDLLCALQSRISYFDQHGCRLSDFGLERIYAFDYKMEEVDKIFKKSMSNEEVSSFEANMYKSCLQYELAKMYHAKNWVQQFHVGAIRNNNKRLQQRVGVDAGCDSIGDISHAESMSALFERLDYMDCLAKTITYNLDPAQNHVFASMMGNYSESGVPGKMQWGSAWWFLDQKDGMENQLNTLSNVGLLSRFVGMLTDSRSFLSFPRHEYFRRILCNLIAEDLNKGLVPNDIDFLGKMIQDICYNNAVTYFDFK